IKSKSARFLKFPLIMFLLFISGCKKDEVVVVPVVSTLSITSITSISAVSVGLITSNGGADVTVRGAVVGTTSQPTIDLATKTTDGDGVGSFTSTLNNLLPGTEYFVRTYATNVAGTAYGNELTFTTGIALPIVTTSSITNIQPTSASGGGEVTSDGGSPILERGICYSKNPTPTIESATKVDSGTGKGVFTASVTNLIDGAIYYVRAFATDSLGTSWG